MRNKIFQKNPREDPWMKFYKVPKVPDEMVQFGPTFDTSKILTNNTSWPNFSKIGQDVRELSWIQQKFEILTTIAILFSHTSCAEK